MRILLLDDSPRHRLAGSEQLRALGHDVMVLHSCEEAINIVRRDEEFDVALIDLLMPAESNTLGEKGMRHLGEEMAVGFPLALLLACERVGAVVCVTDTNHHDHPMSAMVDWFSGKNLVVNGKQVIFTHARIDKDGAKCWDQALRFLEHSRPL